ncbi:MAG: three component ABC system middle component [Pseudomonadota bacterium]
MTGFEDINNGREHPSDDEGSNFNNFAICATGLMAILGETQTLSVAKALLVMPIIMHDSTVRHLGKQNVRAREVSALTSTRPDLFLNFNSRFLAGLTPTLNAIQLLAEAKYIAFNGELVLTKALTFSAAIGDRATRIKKAAQNIAALLASPEDELYLNLRIEL